MSKRILKSGAAVWKDDISEGDSLYFLDPDGHKLELHVGNWQSRLRFAKENPWNSSLEFFDLPMLKNSTSLSVSSSLSLEVLQDTFAVARLDGPSAIPDWGNRE